MTPRTFLIDPVKDLNGHHFNMSISFLSASTASGQHPFWPGSAPDSVRFIPLFSSTIYQSPLGIIAQTLQRLLGERHFIRKMFPESRIEIYPRRKIGSYPHERGAGIAIKSLLAEKPIVTTQGTFTASLASRGTGTIASDAESATDGITHITAHYALFRRTLVNVAKNSCPASIRFQLAEVDKTQTTMAHRPRHLTAL